MATNRPYSAAAAGYVPNGTPSPAPGHLPPGAAPLLPNQGRIVQTGPYRVLCVADVRGDVRMLNKLAKEAKADHIIHTGDFGFYDETSLDRISEKTLKHIAQYSPLIDDAVKRSIQTSGGAPIKPRFTPAQLALSQLPDLLKGNIKLDVPVYTVWGACEDVRVLEKFRSGEYKVNNLHIIDENQSRLIELGGVKLRLLGLGGAVVMHKLFDNGEGRTTIAGGQGTMWATLLQMGELIDTAHRVYDPTETRVFITHASPAREGLLNQLSVTLKADFSISAGLHFRYGSSYNEFSVNPTMDYYRSKLGRSKASFNDVWEAVRGVVEPAVAANEAQQNLLRNALELVEKMPNLGSEGSAASGPNVQGSVDESAFKNMWNFNLADASFGWLVMEIQEGRISTEMKAMGFNFAHRGAKQAGPPAASPTAAPAAAVEKEKPAPSVVSASTTLAAPESDQPAVASPPTKPAQTEPTRSNSGTPAPSAEGATESAPEIIALFVSNVTNDSQIPLLFPTDKYPNLKVDKWGPSNKVVHFATAEERDAALADVAEEFKTRAPDDRDRSKPLVKMFIPRGGRERGPRGDGAWRGGKNGDGGYRSSGQGNGNGASDSETGGRRGGRRSDRGRRNGRRGGREGGEA